MAVAGMTERNSMVNKKGLFTLNLNLDSGYDAKAEIKEAIIAVGKEIIKPFIKELYISGVPKTMAKFPRYSFSGNLNARTGF